MNGATKDLRAALRRMQHEGWTASTTGSGHVLLRHPSGARVTTSATPSCQLATHHLRQDARRALAAAKENGRPKAATESEQ